MTAARAFASMLLGKLERMALQTRLDEIGEGPVAALARSREG